MREKLITPLVNLSSNGISLSAYPSTDCVATKISRSHPIRTNEAPLSTYRPDAVFGNPCSFRLKRRVASGSVASARISNPLDLVPTLCVGSPITVLAKRRLGLYAEEYRSCDLRVVPLPSGNSSGHLNATGDQASPLSESAHLPSVRWFLGDAFLSHTVNEIDRSMFKNVF
jgi:hypothetical protein